MLPVGSLSAFAALVPPFNCARLPLLSSSLHTHSQRLITSRLLLSTTPSHTPPDSRSKPNLNIRWCPFDWCAVGSLVARCGAVRCTSVVGRRVPTVRRCRSIRFDSCLPSCTLASSRPDHIDSPRHVSTRVTYTASLTRSSTAGAGVQRARARAYGDWSHDRDTRHNTRFGSPHALVWIVALVSDDGCGRTTPHQQSSTDVERS
jgi:hypothetical protein